jgi:hypothetical protein
MSKEKCKKIVTSGRMLPFCISPFAFCIILMVAPEVIAMSRPARVRLVVLVAVLLAGAAAAAYFLWPRDQEDPGPNGTVDGPPADPRLTFETPFLNVRPDVAYVGDGACLKCHRKIVDSFHQHAMGRSAALPDTLPDGVEKFAEVNRPRFTSFGNIDYKVERHGDKYVQTETINGPDGKPAITTEAIVVAAIGSGTRGRSYLCSRDGSLWQNGPSWFSEKQIWDLSPGFAPGRHAQRPVVGSCLFCHVNQVEPVAGTLNRFKEPFFGVQAQIGCERCHGPGALHVAEQTDGHIPFFGIDYTIVNPKHLPPDLREDVCRQCHFQGADRVVRRGRSAFDYRPGLPLDLFIAVYVKHSSLTDYHHSVGQVEQVAVSKCEAGSNGRFGCTSCHDPHKAPAPAEKEAFYRQKCLACHQDKGCSLPLPARKDRNDACTVCHMPKAASANIAHTAVTDHRVMRRELPAKDAKGSLPPGEMPIDTLAGHGKRGPSEAERDRDLGIALSRVVGSGKGDATIVRAAGQLLRQATERHRDDADAWEALALMLLALREWAEALRAAEAAVAASPNGEMYLATAAEAALRDRRLDLARDFARRAIDANPGNADNRLLLASALLDGEKYVEAEAELRLLLKLAPNHAQGRTELAASLHRQGRAREALVELDLALLVDPRQAAGLRELFNSRTR